MININNTDVIILAGGEGSRIRAFYPDIPKIMIPIAGRPILEWIVSFFSNHGFKRFTIAIGYLGNVVEKYLSSIVRNGITINTIHDKEPLGTGGATLNSISFSSDPFIVANGDSLISADLSSGWQLLDDNSIDGVIIGTFVQDTNRFGSLKIGADNLLLQFNEKQKGEGFINAGIYFLKKRIFNRFPLRTKLSMEKEIFPELLAKGARIVVHICKTPFVDMGTPEGLEEAEKFIKQYYTGLK